jgi:hypothetical protein
MSRRVGVLAQRFFFLSSRGGRQATELSKSTRSVLWKPWKKLQTGVIVLLQRRECIASSAECVHNYHIAMSWHGRARVRRKRAVGWPCGFVYAWLLSVELLVGGKDWGSKGGRRNEEIRLRMGGERGNTCTSYKRVQRPVRAEADERNWDGCEKGMYFSSPVSRVC